MTTAASVGTAPAKATSLKKPPRLKGGFPLIGHTIDFARDPVGLLQRAYDECGRVAQFKLAGKNVTLFTGPEAHESLFRLPDEVLSPSEAYKMMIPVFGKGVVYDTTPERMYEQLHMLHPALRNKRMRTYTEIIADETHKIISNWGDEGQIEVCEFFATLTSFTSSRCLLGEEFRNEMSEEFARVYEDLEAGIVPLAYVNAHLPIPAFRRRDRARARLGEMVSTIIERRRRKGIHSEDFTQTLMESKYADGTFLSDHEITGILIAAMFAGHHTSSVTTAWALLELLRAPDYYDKVCTEIRGRFPADEGYSFQAMRDLERTEWAIKEALRIHPPLFMLFRAALEDCEIYGYRVKKGDWVSVSPLVAHRENEVFENALEYDPDRYRPGREEDRRPFAYMSFGGGRHKCLGNAFAILQMKTIFGVLLNNYDFELVGDPMDTDFGRIVLGPKPPINVRYRKRGTSNARVSA
ncbi:MAG: cytochrome P450 [Deltaproteobacteria bacterium]|nr:MAG: cytochrome P450 [Deltaproteobacteria bacterium]